MVDREDGRELAHISGEKQPLDVKFLAISSQQEVRAVGHRCQQRLCGTCSVEHSSGNVEGTEHLVPCMCGAVLSLVHVTCVCHLCLCHLFAVLCHLCMSLVRRYGVAQSPAVRFDLSLCTIQIVSVRSMSSQI